MDQTETPNRPENDGDKRMKCDCGLFAHNDDCTKRMTRGEKSDDMINLEAVNETIGVKRMSFTDSDLKRLKEYLSVNWMLPVHPQRYMEHADLSALLSRLEAAERIIIRLGIPEDMDDIGRERWAKDYGAWRKSKGE